MILNILLAIAGFSVMELVAWMNHKYVMHGFMWKWHADHHVNDHRKNSPQNELYRPGLEKNDYFFLVYATPAIVLLVLGLYFSAAKLIALGLGISAYGIIYFLLHDVMIHGRIKIPFLINTRNKYLLSVKDAHLAHHRGKNIKDFNNYGLLTFQRRFLRK